jgi:hypothetical protein
MKVSGNINVPDFTNPPKSGKQILRLNIGRHVPDEERHSGRTIVAAHATITPTAASGRWRSTTVGRSPSMRRSLEGRRSVFPVTVLIRRRSVVAVTVVVVRRRSAVPTGGRRRPATPVAIVPVAAATRPGRRRTVAAVPVGTTGRSAGTATAGTTARTGTTAAAAFGRTRVGTTAAAAIATAVSAATTRAGGTIALRNQARPGIVRIQAAGRHVRTGRRRRGLHTRGGKSLELAQLLALQANLSHAPRIQMLRNDNLFRLIRRYETRVCWTSSNATERRDGDEITVNG